MCFSTHATGYTRDFQHAAPCIKQTEMHLQIPPEICWEKRLFSYPAEVSSLTVIREAPKSATAETPAKQKQPDFPSVDENGNEIASGQTARTNCYCQECSKTFSSLTSLLRHQQYHCHSHHKRPFHCKYCDKLYVSLGALKMHIRTHTLPCKCKICGKAFSRPWLLQGHIRTHTGEKPYKCPNCQRAFADRSNLRAHLQTHSEVKKYSCSLCSKSFSRMSLLLKHEDSGCPGTGSWSVIAKWLTYSSTFDLSLKRIFGFSKSGGLLITCRSKHESIRNQPWVLELREVQAAGFGVYKKKPKL